MDEAVVEEALLVWFADLGYEVAHGPDIAPGEPGAEREDYRDVLLLGRLDAALRRLNPGIPQAAVDEAIRVVSRQTSPSLVVANRVFHRLLAWGVSVEASDLDGSIRGFLVRL